jgi:opacity protein-like surface antigen
MKKQSSFIWSVIITVLFCAASSPVLAQSTSEDDGWNHSLAVYLWGASVSGTTASGSSVVISFKDLVNNLEFGAMAAYQGRKGKWSMLADVIYLDVEGDQQLNLIPPMGPGTGVNVDASLGITAWVVNLAGGYNLYDDNEGTTTDFVFGVRYLDLANDLLLDFSVGNPDLNKPVLIPLSADVWDAIVGARGVISLGDRWFMPWGANIGTGQSDLTWQAMAGLGFKMSSWADLALTYRYLKWELDNDRVDDLSFSGPLLGVVFRF